MARKLTQQEFETKVKLNTNDMYEVISTYEGKRKPIVLICKLHKTVFSMGAECFMRGKDVRGHCPECLQERNQIKLTCAYCQKEFYRPISYTKNSRSGLYFCCREHKDLAQRIDFGLQEIQPAHYNSDKEYRSMAFRNYTHSCAICN